jgi:Cu/Ag efflux protein CusF
MTGGVVPLVTPARAAAPESTKAAEAKAMRLRHLRVEVVAIDQDAKTLTVKRMGRRAKELTFNVETEATTALTDLKPGERIRVGYVETGGKLMAKTIDKAPQPAKK